MEADRSAKLPAWMESGRSSWKTLLNLESGRAWKVYWNSKIHESWKEGSPTR